MDGRTPPVLELIGLLSPGSTVLLLPEGAFGPVPGVPLDTVSPRFTTASQTHPDAVTNLNLLISSICPGSVLVKPMTPDLATPKKIS